MYLTAEGVTDTCLNGYVAFNTSSSALISGGLSSSELFTDFVGALQGHLFVPEEREKPGGTRVAIGTLVASDI